MRQQDAEPRYTITITDLITAVIAASINLPSSLVRDQRDHNKILVTSSWCWHVLTSWSSFVVLNNDQGAITINYTDTSGYITVHTTPRWTAAQDNVISCFMPQHHTTNNIYSWTRVVFVITELVFGAVLIIHTANKLGCTALSSLLREHLHVHRIWSVRTTAKFHSSRYQ